MPGVFSKKQNLASSPSTDIIPPRENERVYEITLGQRSKQNTRVNCTFLEKLPPGQAVRITFECQLPNSTIVISRAVYVNNSLYINVTDGSPSDDCKHAFLMLVDFADKVLNCSYAVVYMPKEKPEREDLSKLFGNLGFFAIPEESPLIHFHGTDYVFMGYVIR